MGYIKLSLFIFCLNEDGDKYAPKRFKKLSNGLSMVAKNLVKYLSDGLSMVASY